MPMVFKLTFLEFGGGLTIPLPVATFKKPKISFKWNYKLLNKIFIISLRNIGLRRLMQ